MLGEVKVPYRILLPNWVFLVSYSEEEIFENAKKYLSKCYPERFLIRVEDRFAICDMKY